MKNLSFPGLPRVLIVDDEPRVRDGLSAQLRQEGMYVESVGDLAEVFGGARRACVAREISKRFEQSVTLPLEQAVDWLLADADRQRGEFVLVVEGCESSADSAEGLRVARLLQAELGPSAAARLAAQITGAPRKALYAALAGDSDES